MISNRALVKSTMDWGSKAPAWTIISWFLRTYSSCHSIWIIKQTHSEHRLGRTLIKASSTKDIGKMNVPFDSFNRQKSLRTKNLLKKGNQWHVRQPWQQCIGTGVFPAADAIIHLRTKAIAFPWDFSVSCAIFLASDNGPSNRRGYCSILPWGKSFYFHCSRNGEPSASTAKAIRENERTWILPDQSNGKHATACLLAVNNWLKWVAEGVI